MFLNAPRADEGGVLSGLWPAGLKKTERSPLKKTGLFQDRLKRKSRESVAANNQAVFPLIPRGEFSRKGFAEKV